MQAWLGLEHEAIWFYPVVGSRFDALTKAAQRSYDAHRLIRDDLLARLDALGTDPVGTALTYEVGALDKAELARKAAQKIEERITAACLTLAGVTESKERAFATASLRRAALAELSWGAEPKAFPGLP